MNKKIIVANMKMNLLSNEIENYLIAFGLIQLHEQAHLQILNNKTDYFKNILDGDYFYSLYYSYAAQHTFYLIEHDFASYLCKNELQCIDEYTPLLDVIQNFLQQGELYYGVS